MEGWIEVGRWEGRVERMKQSSGNGERKRCMVGGRAAYQSLNDVKPFSGFRV